MGRSRCDIQSRLLLHLNGRGNRNLALARRVGASGSLRFEYDCLISVNQVEAQLIRNLGVDKFANLRRETDPADW